MEQKNPLTQQQAILISGALIAASILVGTFLLLSSLKDAGIIPKNKTGGIVPNVVDTSSISIDNVNLDGEPFIGNSQPKIAIAYWCDFQAPACKQFETGILAELQKKYVESGDVAIVFKDLPEFGEDSVTAALYGRAVWNIYPQIYHAWRDAMFSAQDRTNEGFGNKKSIIQLSSTIPGIDPERLDEAVSKNKNAYLAIIEANNKEAKNLGIGGVPTLIVGQKLVSGMTSVDAISALIDAELKNAQ